MTSTTTSRRVYPRGCGGTLVPPVSNVRVKVYPRGCGGTSPPADFRCVYVGLSPRVRGNHLILFFEAEEGRSIPAGAGEPAEGWYHRSPIVVYPRGCGGTHLVAKSFHPLKLNLIFTSSSMFRYRLGRGL